MAATTATEQTDSERVPLLADTPLRDPDLDGFGFVAFAHALCLVIDNERTATPLTIAVSAPWGGGKSSVGGMLQTLLERRVARRDGDRPRLVVWFNAWEHEDAEHLGAALAGAVARAASRHRPLWRRAVFPLPSTMLEYGERLRRTVLTAGVCLLLAAALAILQTRVEFLKALFQVDSSARGAGAVGVALVALLLYQRVFATAKSAARFIDDPRSAAARGSMAEVKQQLGTLIRHATRNGRLVILIDDLDRCDSARALEVCRVAGQLLAHEGVISILLADTARIAEGATARFGTEDIGRRYLEKIAQVELALPPPDPTAMRAVSSRYGASLRAAAPAERPQAPRRKLWRVWWERARWWPLALWLVFFIVAMIVAPTDSEGYVSDGLSTVIGLTLVAAVGIGAWSSVMRRRRRRRQRQEYERQIEELKQAGDLSAEDVRATLLAQTSAADSKLVGDLVSSSFLDSAEFRAVEAFLSTHPSRLPRASKRMYNHAQLLTEIARSRDMFGLLAPEHLAKWLVLRERWPTLGRAVLDEPCVMRELEAAAHSGDLNGHHEGLGLDAHEDHDELLALLVEEPPLAAIIERLIYFMPNGR